MTMMTDTPIRTRILRSTPIRTRIPPTQQNITQARTRTHIRAPVTPLQTTHPQSHLPTATTMIRMRTSIMPQLSGEVTIITIITGIVIICGECSST